MDNLGTHLRATGDRAVDPGDHGRGAGGWLWESRTTVRISLSLVHSLSWAAADGGSMSFIVWFESFSMGKWLSRL
jgi:hypothetical protein